jgi:Putative RNA methylase family UPF0020
MPKRKHVQAVSILSAFSISMRYTSVSALQFASRLHRWRPEAAPKLMAQSKSRAEITDYSGDRLSPNLPLSAERRLLIHWRGEGVEGYSMQFRHVEFRGALEAVLASDQGQYGLDSMSFKNALNYTGGELTSEIKIAGYNQAMQYLTVPNNVSTVICALAAQRCSLIHALYEVVAETSSEHGYSGLAETALQNQALRDMWVDSDGANSFATWCVRVRHYGDNSNGAKERRYGARARSLTMEREALQALSPLLIKLGGKVDLDRPDCKIYVFDGLRHSQSAPGSFGEAKVLARRIAKGAKTSSINPNTRICVTNTPLCPVAAFIMGNVAGIRAGSSALDPYCGSGGTLLAASMLSNSSSTVGIEIAHNGIVNRDDINKDFLVRGLTQPLALILGDSSDCRVRALARQANGGKPFDCIITDPPYGIRESTGGPQRRPIDDLLQMIIDDREAGTPILRHGGRLVAFLPHQTEDESVDDILPMSEQVLAAGLCLDVIREQPLNDLLSRWLVSYVCTRT